MTVLLKLNLQQFKADPDNVLLQDAVTGQVPFTQGELILTQFMQQSTIAQLAQHEEMTAPVKTFTYLAEGPGAYWVSETERIQTSKAKWLTARMEAHKVGVIIPVSKEFLRYTLTNFFNMIRPAIVGAFALKVDQSSLFGASDSPFVTGTSVWERIQASGNAVPLSDDLYNDLNRAIGLIEAVDGNPNGLTTTRRFNQNLRGARDTTNKPIFNDARQGATAEALGLPIGYANAESWDFAKALLMTADWSYARYGVLQDIEYDISTDATLTTITDDGDDSLYNLFERDMFALRATMHVGFMTLKDGAFAAITPASAGTTETIKTLSVTPKQPDKEQEGKEQEGNTDGVVEAVISNLQNGVAVDEDDLKELTNDQLKFICDTLSVEYAAKATKADLISLILG